MSSGIGWDENREKEKAVIRIEKISDGTYPRPYPKHLASWRHGGRIIRGAAANRQSWHLFLYRGRAHPGEGIRDGQIDLNWPWTPFSTCY